MRGVERSLNGVERATTSARLQTGRLGNQFANLAGQIAHVHPIVGNLAGVLGNFAIGSVLTVGILAGVAAIAVAYDKITESSRKAKEQTDKFIQSLVAQARAAREATIAGAEFNELIADIELQAAKKASGVGIRSVLGAIVTGKPGLDPADASAAAKRIADAQTAVEQSIIRTAKAYENANKPIKETITRTDELTFRFNQLREAADRVNAAAAKDVGNFWRGYIEQTKAALSLTEQLNNAIMADRPTLLESFRGLMTQGAPGAVNMPNISMPFEGLTEKQKQNLIELGVIKDDANKNARDTQAAIWGAAIQSANIIAGALNIGGGGRGSGIGGALGGAIGGAALGGKLGAFGGPIGAVVGAIAGSFIGGLFDHKKAVETNTAAVRQNTAALLLNTPSGYKTASGRFDATEVKEFRRGLQRYATRGGAPILVAP